MQGPRIAAVDLACRRGHRLLFRGLSFSLAPGEALQVAGANGVGKSSLLRLLAGLGRPFSGTVQREGAVGLVDERSALDPEATLGGALAFWNRIDGTRAVGVRTLGLYDLLDVPVRYLSTGQRKRAALARLLGQDTAIWLLDEPLNGLDVTAIALVERLIAEHCAAGGIAVIASHQALTAPGLTGIALEEFAA